MAYVSLSPSSSTLNQAITVSFNILANLPIIQRYVVVLPTALLKIGHPHPA
jgi:hypothetical protein